MLYLVEHYWGGDEPSVYLVTCDHHPGDGEVCEALDLEFDVGDYLEISEQHSTAIGAGKPLVVICEVTGGVAYTYASDDVITCYTLDHDDIEAGDKHDIPDDAFLACGLDPEHYRTLAEMEAND